MVITPVFQTGDRGSIPLTRSKKHPNKLHMEKLPTLYKLVFSRERAPGNKHTLRHNQCEVDVYKLIHLTREIPNTTILTSDYIADLNDRCWTDNNGEKISPQDIIKAFREAGDFKKTIIAHPEFSHHIRGIEKADLSHPVIIFESGIIDGMHRFVKAVLEERTDLQAKVINEIPKTAIIKIYKNDTAPK